ncbi:hypothetical protein [Ornithinimicrobium kibberense]|uniref:hypothetical protein n=1 Tax=Ornithinimicrobium kibberense TaxID=282060 RepID=UPI003623220F
MAPRSWPSRPGLATTTRNGDEVMAADYRRPWARPGAPARRLTASRGAPPAAADA